MSKMSQKKILKQYLETVYDQQGKRKDSLYGIILERGRFFKPVPLPDGLELGEQGLCYRNSYLEMSRSKRDLSYVEGYACSATVPGFPLMHAWVCEPGSNEAFDVTWPAGLAYFGIEWPTQLVFRSAKKIEYAGILPNLYRLMRHDDCNPFKAEAWAKKD